MNLQITAPVLLIAFNRPDNTKIVFNKIREAQPTKLYIAVDGARNNEQGEKDLVSQVIKIVKNVDWKCETHYRFNDLNKGAEITVSSAVSWVFEQEEFAIVLEDDIIAPLSFFKFVQEMLIKYKEDERIGIVSGSNFTPIILPNNEDYTFTKYGHTQGWATWKRIWDKFDLNMEVQKRHLKTSFLKSITNSRKELRHYKRKFKKIKKNGVGNSTWDNVVSYMQRTNNLLYIIPRVNLISNIGVYGLHAHGRTKYHYIDFDENFIVKNHPHNIACNVEYDKYHFEHYIFQQKPIYKKIFNKVKIAL